MLCDNALNEHVLCFSKASYPASATDDHDTYLFDDNALCDEFDLLNNLTDSDEPLSPEGTRYLAVSTTFFLLSIINKLNLLYTVLKKKLANYGEL